MGDIVCNLLDKNYRNKKALNKLSCSIEGEKNYWFNRTQWCGEVYMAKTVGGSFKTDRW